MALLSIRQLPPLERGGVIARVGLSLQDHVGAGFVIDMFDDQKLAEVWCETQDDITLIWNTSSTEEVEFVQVKSELVKGFWTTARLCHREEKRLGTSVIERLIACDRAAEEPRFRIITARDVADELRCLTYPVGAPGRTDAALKQLCAQLEAKLPRTVSPNSRAFDFIVARTLWTIVHGEPQVRQANILKLQRHIEATGVTLALDQIEELYSGIVSRVADASRARWEEGADAKQIRRRDVVDWLERSVERATSPKLARANFVPKMRTAGLSVTDIAAAQELRRRYHQERLNPKYLSTTQYELVEAECLALLQRLRAQFDINRTMSSQQFYSHCLEQTSQLVVNLRRAGEVPLFFAQGYVFEVVNRCLHRFARGEA
jgi:hypothetical protein